jgi:hypothetical protein
MVAWRLLIHLSENREFDAPKTIRNTELEYLMSPNNSQRRHCEKTSRKIAVEFLDGNGSNLEAAATLEVNPTGLQTWKQKSGVHRNLAKALGGMAKLRAENEALRNEIVHLQVQWEDLKVNLEVLSLPICSHRTI